VTTVTKYSFLRAGVHDTRPHRHSLPSFPRSRESTQTSDPPQPDTRPPSRGACLCLPGSENSCIIGAGEESREGGDMAGQPAENLKNIRHQRRIFPRCVRKYLQHFSNLPDSHSPGGRITGISAPICNTRRFRRSFSS